MTPDRAQLAIELSDMTIQRDDSEDSAQDEPKRERTMGSSRVLGIQAPSRAAIGRDVTLLLAVCAIGIWWRLGALGLIDPDEPFYAQTAREMLERHDWIVPHIFGAPQFEKPILYYWLTMISYSVLGVSEFAGRLAPASFGTLLVLATYAFGARAIDRRSGFLSALVLATGLVFVVMSRLMLTDVVFAVFVAGSIFSFYCASREERTRTPWIVAHFACAALAVLTKGPLGSLVPALAVIAFTIVSRTRSPLRGRPLVLGLCAYVLLALPWYAIMLARFGFAYFQAFFVHENYERLIHAEHSGNNHVWFYPAILLLGSLPWIPLVAILVLRGRRIVRTSPFLSLMSCWFGTSFVFLTIVQSKLPSYAFFLFVPLALLAGSALPAILRDGFENRVERAVFLGLSALQALALPLAAGFNAALRELVLLPTLGFGALLALALALQWKKPTRLGIGATALAPLALFAIVLAFSARSVEALTSVKPDVAELVRMQHAGEPIVTDRLLARGVTYYTRQPVTVVAESPTPYWTAHPLPILVGKTALDRFVRTHGDVMCLMRRGEWERMASTAQQEESRYLGERVVAELHGEIPKTD